MGVSGVSASMPGQMGVMYAASLKVMEEVMDMAEESMTALLSGMQPMPDGVGQIIDVLA